MEYKPGSLDTVANALSWREEHTAVVAALSMAMFIVHDQIRQEINGDSGLSLLRDAIRGGVKPAPWKVVNGLILFKGRVYISPSSSILPTILESVHGVGHEGVHKTLHRLRADFHVPNDCVVIQDFVRACAVCQRNKSEHLQPGGLLQPLEVPSIVWANVAIISSRHCPKCMGNRSS